ncbi:Dipeptide and tripeptide permease B [compost metagenome]
MIIGVITFLLTKKHLAPIGNSPLENQTPKKRNLYEIAVYLGSFAVIPLVYIMVINSDFTEYFMYTIGILALGYFLYELIMIKERKQQLKFLAAFIFIFAYFMFMAISEQSGGSLSLFAKDNLTNKLLFFNIDPNVVNNSINSLYVIIFSPLVGILWIYMFNRKIEPNTVVKFGLSFILLAAGFFIFYSARFFVNADGLSSLDVFALGYLLYTLGELCIGPIGMSVITKLSPKRLFGMMMGLWFLSSAFGQFAAGKLGAEMSNANTGTTLMSKLMAYTDGYYQLAIYALVTGIAFIVLTPLIRKLMQEVK